MVVCKYFQQGTCRFGQYCRFEHNNYGGNNQTERNKPYGESKSVVLEVAGEILASERGGQWLLSCFGPFKELSCIPGMDDVSPEEVRWEMYQAQKNGTVDQTKLQFQQLCQAMSAKRDALKNPTHETASMLEKMQKGNKDGDFGAKNNFALSTSQLANNNSGTNIFGAKTFGTTSGPFSGGFPVSTATTTSVFDRSNTNSTSVFGAKASFGGNAIFGSQPVTNSMFGGANSTTASVFGGAQQNMPPFGPATQTSASFLSTPPKPQSIFGQSATFGAAVQQNNIFPTTQSTTSVFSGSATTPTPLFASSLTTQVNASPFGSTAQGATTQFGGATTIQPSGSIFGNGAAAPASSSIGSASIFGQPQTTVAFGGAPIFGSAASFGGAVPTSNYATPPAFSNSTNVFGTPTTTSTFASNAQATNTFSALAIPGQNVFTNSQNSNPTFGNVSSNDTSTLSATTFGSVPLPPTTTTTMAFANPPFGAAANSPFTRTSTFGPSITSHNPTSIFGTAVPSPPAFGSTIATTGFANAPPSTPFASTTTTTTTSNPFAPRSQQITTSFASTPSGTTFGGMSVGPFGNLAYSSADATAIDSSNYSVDIDLSDDEKNMYMSDQFILGKIPLKPPTIELR